MFGRSRKKNKNKTPTGKISNMIVNGVESRCLNIRIFYDKDGVGRLELYSKEPNEALHYDTVDLKINTLDNKQLNIKGKFDSAAKEGKIYHYMFVIDEYNEYFA